MKGKLLWINLTTKEIKIENIEEKIMRQYMGGRGLSAYYISRLTNSSIKPLDKENPLIFSSGIVTGSSVAGSGRHSIASISPLTNYFTSSEAGGYFGTEIKKAGYDCIIVIGANDKMCYLLIQDNNVEIIEDESIKGQSTIEVDERIREKYGKSVHIAQCGPAGEKLIPYSCVTHDLRSFAGRGGLGAVMGSKKLRAIVVKGTNKVKIKNNDYLNKIKKDNIKDIINNSTSLTKYGTAGIVMGLNELGGLPTRNFKEGVFEGAEKLSGESLTEKYITKHETCYGCPIRCKPVAEINDKYVVSSKTGAPEYETIAALGSLCSVDDMQAVCKGNELCTEYGLDTISTGCVIAYAMECYENGYLTKKDTQNIELKFGNSEAMVKLIHKIANQEGIGKILSKGVKEAAAIIDEDTNKYAMHVKGQELPLHEPRLKFGMGLGYAISPTGADHQHNMHDTDFDEEPGFLKNFGIFESMDAQILNCKKTYALVEYSSWRHFLDCAVLCHFVPWSARNVVEIIDAITDWKTNFYELIKVGKRASTLARCINISRGLKPEEDTLPKRFSNPFLKGPLKDKKITNENLEQAKKSYYVLMGYDENGIPTKETLASLDIDFKFQ